MYVCFDKVVIRSHKANEVTMESKVLQNSKRESRLSTERHLKGQWFKKQGIGKSLKVQKFSLSEELSKIINTQKISNKENIIGR